MGIFGVVGGEDPMVIVVVVVLPFACRLSGGGGGWFSPVYAIVRPFRCIRVDRGKERYGEKHVYSSF